MNELTDDNDDFETELSIRETATECQEEDDDDYEEEEDTDNINADRNVLSQLEMHITSQTAAAQQQHIQQSRALNSILEDDESVLGKTSTAPACPLPILSTPFLTPLAVSDISTKSHNQLLQRRSHEEVFDKNSNGAMENETMDWTIEKFIQQQPSSSVHCEEMVQNFEESSDDDEAIENETMEWRRNRLEREELYSSKNPELHAQFSLQVICLF